MRYFWNPIREDLKQTCDNNIISALLCSDYIEVSKKRFEIITVQILCVKVPWTMSPTTDLIAEIRMSLRCSAQKAAKLFEKAIMAGAIQQITKTENEPSPVSSLNIPTVFTKWEPVTGGS